METEESEMITLGVASKETGVPSASLRYYIRVGIIWGEKRVSPMGEYYVTTREEARRAQAIYRPQGNPNPVKKQ